MSRVTKVEFNCLKLVLSIDSWVAVLDFFGIAGDEPDQSSTATDSNQTSELIVCILFWEVSLLRKGTVENISLKI